MAQRPCLIWLLTGSALSLACSSDGVSKSAAVVDHLRECKVVTEGKVRVRVADTELAACNADCQVQTSCEELGALLCERDYSARFRDCISDCERPKPCADGRGAFSPNERCDQREQCIDGSDEHGCPDPATDPRYCVASGDPIRPTQRCDGREDCSDGTDEKNCPEPGPTFTCATGRPVLILANQACDLIRDCEDGSDEITELGCARLACN